MKIIRPEKMVEYFSTIKVKIPDSGKKPKHGFFLDVVAAFDIETSVIYPEPDNPQAIMYIWQFAANDMVTYGRTWDEYIAMIEGIKKVTPAETRIYCAVHNLSYEFQWLSGVFHFKEDDVFCIQPRKILYARYDQIEYRCSMLLSNDSLAGFCDKHKVQHVKQSGEDFDYSKVRYPWTPLTNYEMKYALYDVVGLVECIKAEMKMNGDDLYTLPYTSTGYVRRDVKRVLFKWNRRHQFYLQPDTEHLYRRLKECFRGGNTHANRYFANMTLHKEDGPYWSYDLSSSYPAQIILRKYPMTNWKEGPTEWENVVDLRDRGYCMLLVFRAFDVRLRDPEDGFPPLSESKCRDLLEARDERGRLIRDDNGRVLAADYLETTMTDIDFDIFLKHYDAQIEFLETWYCCYGFLPDELRNYVKQLYIDKTALKGKEDEQSLIRYAQAKARINSVYGLMVQDQIKPMIKYVDGEYIEDPDFNVEEALAKNKQKAYLSYSWGCWVTAWARKALQDGIDKAAERTEDPAQRAYPIYCDTDSIKGCGLVDLEEINRKAIARATKAGAYATDIKGNVHYIGVFEREHDMEEFRTLGAKKYAYTIDGQVFITIAGVGKKAGAKILQSAGGLDEMKEGFIFKGATSDAIYNDEPYGFYDVDPGDGHFLYISKNVALIPGDYTLGLTQEYTYILEHPEIFYDVWRVV